MGLHSYIGEVVKNCVFFFVSQAHNLPCAIHPHIKRHGPIQSWMEKLLPKHQVLGQLIHSLNVS
jgi:hypothetical protein